MREKMSMNNINKNHKFNSGKISKVKKLFAILMVVVAFSSLVGCRGGNIQTNEEGKINIVATIFPAYDWTKEITKDCKNVEIKMLLDGGVDMHSYQPTADDIIMISNCDVFIYVGGESDAWVEDVLKTAKNKDMKVINMLEVLGDNVKEEEIVEGMEAEDEGDEDEAEYDEHVWLSLRNARIICQEISDVLIAIDEGNKERYTANKDAYLSQLDDLDKQYAEVVSSAKYDTVLFADRFPFRYMVNDYDIKYYAAFVGCSAESEASFETITYLSNKIDELDIDVILQLESSDGKLSSAIKSNTKDKNQEILVMDSLQSVTSKDVSNGTTYLNVMESNLNVLDDALN